MVLYGPRQPRNLIPGRIQHREMTKRLGTLVKGVGDAWTITYGAQKHDHRPLLTLHLR